MHFYLKFVYLYYWVLTILAILAPLSYPVTDYLPAFFIMWFSFICFNAGCKKGMKINNPPLSKDYRVKNLDKYTFLFVVFLLVFIPLYVKFYTGSLFTSLIMGFGSSVSSESNYQEYQRYFEDNELGVFSLSKLPYIVGFGIAKLLYYFFVLCYVGYARRITKKNMIIIFLMFLLFFLVGISRGTNFESFELLVLLLFSMLVRSKLVNNLNFFPRKQMLGMLIFVALIILFFQFSKSLRSGGDMLTLAGGPTSTYTFDKSHWTVLYIPAIAALALSFSGYFSFGLYYTSELFWRIWMGSFSEFIGALIPYGGPIFSEYGNYRDALEASGFDAGACWSPDCTIFIFYLGIPLFFVLVYNMGKIAARSYKKSVEHRDVGHCLVLFMIVYEMISFPVGNFLMISSSNKIVLLLIIIIVYFDYLKKYRIR